MAKRKYGLWKPGDMRKALADFKEGNIGLNDCFRRHGIPKRSFKRHLEGSVQRGVCDLSKKSINGRDSDLPEEIEEEVVQHILKFEENMFNLSIADVRKLAFEIVERNQIKNIDSMQIKKMAGKKWFYSFMKRHPTLSLRQLEYISMARVEGFNKENVSGFIDILERVDDENNIEALRIFNADEASRKSTR
jgi:hypothetical protein